MDAEGADVPEWNAPTPEDGQAGTTSLPARSGEGTSSVTKDRTGTAAPTSVTASTRLELTRLYATDDAISDGIDFFALADFSLVIAVKPAGTDCPARWPGAAGRFGQVPAPPSGGHLDTAHQDQPGGGGLRRERACGYDQRAEQVCIGTDG